MTETHTRGSRGRRFLSRERRDAATLSRDEGDPCGTFRSIGDETGRRRHCLYFDTEAYFMNFFTAASLVRRIDCAPANLHD